MTPERPASRPPRLVSQLSVPHEPRDLVERPRLFERLQAGVEGQVTLVCGPAGSGKTALLSSWLRHEPGLPVAWVSLEPPDDEPVRFWDAVLTALRGLDDVAPDSPLAGLAP